MRSARRVGILILLAALLATGCASDKEEKSSGPAQTGAPARQELTVGLGADSYTVSGPRANLAYDLNVYDTLVVIGPQYDIKPMLAERWELRDNTWRFSLRRGVKFQDGQPLNAQAVKTGLFDRVAATGGGTIRAAADSAVVVDDYTIDFTAAGEPNFRVPEQIGHPSNFVAAPNSDPGAKPVGTGPFRFVSYQPKESVVVERNPDYWGTKAKLDRITFRFIPDANTRRLALESGQVDLIANVPTPDVKALKAKNDLQVATSAVGAYDAIYLNIHTPDPYDLLQQKELRQAIAYSLDRKAIATGVLDGQATADPTFVPPSALGQYASTVKGYPYDPARAKSMLDAAGWRVGSDGIRSKEGRRLKLQFVAGLPSADAVRPIPAYVQSQLKDIGMDIEVVERPDSASFQSLLTDGKGDIFIEQGNQNDADISFLPKLLFYSRGSGASANYVGRFGPGGRYDDLIQSTLTEPNVEKVRQATAEALHILIDDEAIVVPLAGVFRIWGMKRSVQGFVAHPSSINTRWDTISIGA